MRAAAVLAVITALSLAPPTAAAPPRAGVLAPGRSLGGVALGASERAVLRAWGNGHGTCENCARPTWYFNYVPFRPQGAGVAFRAGRVVAVFTLWSPVGWRTTRGLALGDPVARVTSVYGPLDRADCDGYYALTLARGDTVTAFYVVGDRVYGFGLSRPGTPSCR